MQKGLKIFLFCLSSFSFIGCDRITKDLAREHLMNKEAISFFHDTFRLEYVENTGAFLGLGDSLPETVSFWLLSMLPLAFLLGLFIYTIKNSRQFSFTRMLFLSLIFAGGIGNIIDRILFQRHVTDFMNLGIQNLRTGIFNVADMCVMAGVIGFILFYRNKSSRTTSS